NGRLRSSRSSGGNNMAAATQERISQIRNKVERAAKHFMDLKIECRRFLDTDPYIIRANNDPHTGKLIAYIDSIKDIPVDTRLIPGDTIHNLRSALDHLACQLVIANGGTLSRETAYPFYKDLKSFNTNSGGQVQGMDQGAVNIINGTKPYQGGDNLLWSL